MKEEPLRISTGHVLHFSLGEVVYLKSDTEQKKRVVIGILLMPHKGVNYQLACGEILTSHYAIEITSEKDIL